MSFLQYFFVIYHSKLKYFPWAIHSFLTKHISHYSATFHQAMLLISPENRTCSLLNSGFTYSIFLSLTFANTFSLPVHTLHILYKPINSNLLKKAFQLFSSTLLFWSIPFTLHLLLLCWVFTFHTWTLWVETPFEW